MWSLLQAIKAIPPPQSPPEETDVDAYRIDRRDLSYTGYILSAWQRAIIRLQQDHAHPGWSFPTYNQVSALTQTTTKNYINYEHASVKWRSSYFVKVFNNVPVLIIQLANDGLLYFDPDMFLQADSDGVVNNHHSNTTTPSGWNVFKQGELREGVKAKLSDFRVFAEAWFGTSEIRQSILYNSEFCQLDVCFQSKDKGVGLEFSLVHDWFLAEENSWWDE